MNLYAKHETISYYFAEDIAACFSESRQEESINMEIGPGIYLYAAPNTENPGALRIRIIDGNGTSLAGDVLCKKGDKKKAKDAVGKLLADASSAPAKKDKVA